MFWQRRKSVFLKKRLENSPDETAFLNSQDGVKAEVRHIDFLHPALPPFWIEAGERASDFLEKVPLLRSVSGSLAIWGEIEK